MGCSVLRHRTEISSLHYSQKLLSTAGVSGVLALFVAAPHQQAQATSQETALFQLGNVSAKPVIPGRYMYM
jgi:hypothetical protein